MEPGKAGSNVVHDLPKGAAQVTDPNPVEWRHVYAQLEQNFPNDAIEWVKRARWIGPVNVPWSRVDTDDEDHPATSHQPDAVNRFARGISSGDGNAAPSVLVQEPGSNRAFIVDGHHRALARRKLGKPVLAYVGNIDPRDRQAAMETHSSQVHQGNDPANKSPRTPYLSTHHAPIGHEGVWRSEHPPMQLPAYIQQIRNALMGDGHSEQEAHALAVAAVERWKEGGDHVTPEVSRPHRRRPPSSG